MEATTIYPFLTSSLLLELENHYFHTFNWNLRGLIMQIEIQNQCQNFKLFPDSGLVIIYYDFSIMLVTQDILLLNHKKSCGRGRFKPPETLRKNNFLTKEEIDEKSESQIGQGGGGYLSTTRKAT